MTIIAVDIFYKSGCALLACFALPSDLQLATGSYIAGLESLSEHLLGKDPTESLCGYLAEMSSEDDHDDWFIKAEKILTLWMDGKPVKIIRTSVHYAEEGDKHIGVLETDTVADIETAWHVVKHLELQFRTAVWVQELDEKDPSMRRPEWSVPIVGCELSRNPLYSAMKFLTQATQIDPAPPKAEKTPIERLNLSGRAENPLNRADIRYVEDLIEKGFVQLTKLRHFGSASFLEVRTRLQSRGFKLPARWKMPGDQKRGWVPDIQ